MTTERTSTDRPSNDQPVIDRPPTVPQQNNPPQSQAPGKSRWAFSVATFCGIGYFKPAPGSWASLATVLLWGLAAWALHLGTHGLLVLLAAAIVLSVAFGVPASGIAARQSGREDPGFVVIDEVAGQCVALLGCSTDWAQALVCLVLFRIFDITKPFPIRHLEDLPDGWGIVFDDLAAGLYALGVMVLVRIAWPHL